MSEPRPIYNAQTIELHEACDELAQLIRDDEFFMPGYAIQFFMAHVDEGETPAMALALTKNETNGKQEADT